MLTPVRNRRGTLGFTLIELLVVITIIGIMAGVIGFNMMADDPSRDVRREAERFLLVMRQALDEATFSQSQLGLYIDEEGYRFGHWEITELEDDNSQTNNNPGLSTNASAGPVNSQLNRLQNGVKRPERVGKWQPLVGKKALREYAFPEHIGVILDVPDSELLTDLTVTQESRLTKTNLNLEDIGPKIDEEPGLPPPPVYVLSSGEMTPFWVTLYYVDDSTMQARIEADELGRVRIVESDEL